MADEYARIVDRQLACARIQIDFARASEKYFLQTACLNACCFHLAESLLAYLKELQLGSYNSIQNGSSLAIIFGELEQLPQVADFRLGEVIALAFSRQSWLHNLVNLQCCLRTPGTSVLLHQVRKVRPAGDNLIASSSFPHDNSCSDKITAIEPSIDMMVSILDGMTSLVISHREFSAEY